MSDRASFRFEPKTDRFLATSYAASPWTPNTCHGGATVALFAHIAESLPSLAPMDVARITSDLLRPVPLHSSLTVNSKILRDGKRMQLAKITISVGEMQVAHALVLRVQKARQKSQIGAEVAVSIAVPNEGAPVYPLPDGFAELFTVVVVDGVPGQGDRRRVWFRFDDVLVEGSVSTPLQRAVAAADFGGGMSSPLDHTEWAYPSVDLTVSFHRQPIGAWTLVDACSSFTHDHLAICHANLFDEKGLFGHSLQTVLIHPR